MDKKTTNTDKKRRVSVTAIIAIVIVAFIGLGLVRRCNTGQSSLAREYRRAGGDTLAVAIEMSPLTYNLQNDTASGFDYEVLRDIAMRHGLSLKFYPVAEPADAFRGLNDGQYDLLVASIAATSALKEYFPLTDAVYTDRQVLVQRRDTAGSVAVTAPEQLRGDTVWIADGSTVRTRLANLSHELGDTIHVVSHAGYSAEHLAILTALGEVRQAVVPRAVAQRIAADYPQLDISTPVSFNGFQVWAVAPGDSVLLDSLNTWLGQFKSTPQFEALAAKYLSGNQSHTL